MIIIYGRRSTLGDPLPFNRRSERYAIRYKVLAASVQLHVNEMVVFTKSNQPEFSRAHLRVLLKKVIEMSHFSKSQRIRDISHAQITIT